MKKEVKGAGIEEISQLTLENLLLEKFRSLQEAREAGDADFFDAFSQSIEILLKASPKAYNDIMTIKQEMQRELEAEYINIQTDASKAQDEIYKQHILETRIEEADWLFRITYEEALIEVMQKNHIIGMISSETPEILPDVDETQIEQQTEPEQELNIDVPKTKIGKAKLLRQQK